MKSGSENRLRLHQIKSFCAVYPDANIFLHYIFNEEEFKPKITYFTKMVKKGIVCEILPQVNREIYKKLLIATEEYSKTMRRCRSLLQKIVGASLAKVLVRKEIAETIEKVFAIIFNEISKKHFPRVKMKTDAIRRARVVETSVMLALWNVVNESQEIPMNSFFDMLENEFKEKYIEFCDKQSLFMKELNSNQINIEDLQETTYDLRDMIINCGVRNPKDVVVLCQAISRMYSTNKWSAVVTIDYGDMVRNQSLVEQCTQLIISDPLYFMYHFDKKINIALNPKEGAVRMKIPFSSFIKSFRPVGVV